MARIEQSSENVSLSTPKPILETVKNTCDRDS